MFVLAFQRPGCSATQGFNPMSLTLGKKVHSVQDCAEACHPPTPKAPVSLKILGGFKKVNHLIFNVLRF